MGNLLLRRREMMISAGREPTPTDITAWKNISNNYIGVNNNVFTFNYSSAIRGIDYTRELVPSVELHAGDVFTLSFFDARKGSIRVKGSGLSQKTLSSTTTSASWTIGSDTTLSAIQFTQMGAPSENPWSSRIQLTLNGNIILGNKFS